MLKDVCLPIVKADPAELGRGTIRYIDIGSVDGARHMLSNVLEIQAADAPSRCRQVVQAGDTLFSTVRPYLEKIAYVDESLDDEFASTGFCVLRPGPRLLPRYLYYFSISPLMLGQVLPFQKGVSYPAVLDKEVRAAEIPIPPLDEQRRIVELLDDHLSRLDVAWESVNTSIRRLSAMVTSSLSTIVAAGSVGSPVSTVGSEAELVEYGSSARCHAPPSNGDIPVLRMGNLKEGRIDPRDLKFLPKTHPEFPKLLLAPGDLLFNRTNSAELVGKSAVFDSAIVTSFASYLIRVRFKPTVDPRWASIVINSPQGRAYIASVATQQVGQANVNGTKLKAFPLPMPTLSRQKELAAAHERIVDDARRLSAAAEGSLSRSAALRRSLLAAAFSGQLTAERAPA
jgi:type I restriction enzyme S subunit